MSDETKTKFKFKRGDRFKLELGTPLAWWHSQPTGTTIEIVTLWRVLPMQTPVYKIRVVDGSNAGHEFDAWAADVEEGVRRRKLIPVAKEG